MSEYFLYQGRKFVLASSQEGEGIRFFHNEDKNTDIFDWDNRPCAVKGCPAVMLISDRADTFFTKYWQFYLVAINREDGMLLNSIWHLLGPTKALTNRDDDKPVRNYILDEDTDATECPRLDKLRTFSRNTHLAVREGSLWRLLTMDGTQPPPLKPGRVQPERLEDVRLDDYLYTPQTHPFLFLDCNNIQLKTGATSIFPFDGGAIRPWLDEDPHTFFPLVSIYAAIYLNPNNWTELESWRATPSPFRRI